ncbi:cyclin-dependent kinase 4 [Bacillus rossius redtenbacheri]|uniref:cyclin-dependent kinase 4 n=1 Tax=Bacillus rossius redtenbacheri TaxID=93214 RepID=UPI002FDE48C2
MHSQLGAAAGVAGPPLHFRDHGDYEELAVIGNGAYGTVYKARNVASDAVVAMKKVRVPFTEEGIPTSTMREIAMLKQLDQYEHPNIVRLLDICHGEKLRSEQRLTLYLIFEHVDQDLACYLERCPPPGLPPSRIKDMMFQILSGVDFLHSHRVVHRDLKPQNLLVTAAGVVKLADFGLAKSYDFDMRLTSVVVTLWYRSPEVLLGLSYSSALDLWSCGCIMAELFRRAPLFPGNSEGDQLNRIFEVVGTPRQEEWPERSSILWSSLVYRPPAPLVSLMPELCVPGEDLLKKLLKFDPEERILAREALRHPYFSEAGLVPAEPKPAGLGTGPQAS